MKRDEQARAIRQLAEILACTAVNDAAESAKMFERHIRDALTATYSRAMREAAEVAEAEEAYLDELALKMDRIGQHGSRNEMESRSKSVAAVARKLRAKATEDTPAPEEPGA